MRSKSGALPWRLLPGAAPWRVARASEASATRAAGCGSAPSIAAGWTSGDTTSGAPLGVVVPIAAASAPGGPCLPAPPLEEGPSWATGRATATTRFSQGPLRPAGRSPHSSKLGVCFTKSPLLEQRYSKAPPCRMLLGEGSPVRIMRTFLSGSGVRSSSWSLMRSSHPPKDHIL